MPATIEVYYNFRSPYAYFASHRIQDGAISRCGYTWIWRPVSIDALLNLQAGRAPWASYLDPLSPPKRAHLVADVRRLAAYYSVPLRPTNPRRPNSIPALCFAALLDERERSAFNHAVFEALWQSQRDISSPEVLDKCLAHAGARSELLDAAFQDSARSDLANDTSEDFARGIFGVPTFIFDGEIFFGNDRLELLLWSVEQRLSR